MKIDLNRNTGGYKKLIFVFCAISIAEFFIHAYLDSIAHWGGMAKYLQDGGLVAIVCIPFIYLLLRARNAARASSVGQEQAVEALLEEKNKLDEILACVGDGISIQDPEMKIIYQNPAEVKITGPHVGERCYKAYEGNDAACDGCPMTASFEDGKVHISERHSKVIGRNDDVEITASPLWDIDGNIIGGIEVVRDVTQRKAAEKALRDNNERLVSLNMKLAALNEVAKIIASTQEIGAMLQRVLEKTFSIPFLELQKKGAIFLCDEKGGDKLNMAAQVGLHPYLIEHESSIDSGKCLCGLAAQSGEVQISSDCFDDPRHTSNYPGMKCHGHVIVPIKSNGITLGVINHYLEPGVVPSESEVNILTAIANQLAVGISNRRFLEKISTDKKEWETTFNAMEEVVTVHASDYTVLRANTAASNFLGKTIDEIVGQKCYELFHCADGPISSCPAKKLLKGLDSSARHEISSGGKFFEITLYPVSLDGQINSYIHIAKDVTEQKLAGRALQESEEKFRNLVEQSLVGVYIIQDGMLKYVNPRFAEIFEYEIHEMVNGMSPKEFVYPPDWPMVTEHIRKRESGESPILNYAFRGITKKGKIIHVDIHGSNIVYFGKLAGMGTLIDVTETILARDELVRKTQEAVILKQARAQSEEVNRLKSEFLANMSHELRTPLNAVIGLSQVLMEKTYGPLVEKQEDYLKGINQSGQHLIRLINDILDLSKIEAGKEELELAEFSLLDLLNNSFIMIREKAQRCSIELVRDIDPEIGNFVGDERRIKQIIYNLLSNAIKFTNPGGEIGLKAYRQDDELTITVRDNGIGIPDDKKHLIFRPFQLVDSSLSRRHQGTGLGLVLSKKLVEMHHGSLSFESEEGKGTSFTVKLPTPALEKSRALEEAAGEWLPDSRCPESHKIMVVEDNNLNMLLVVDYLGQKGCQVFEAYSGEEALAKVKESGPDIILMDIQMPGLDGFQTLKKLKEMPEAASIPVIAMTALAMKGDEERCIDAGFDDYISKPVNLGEMVEKIQAQLMKGVANE